MEYTVQDPAGNEHVLEGPAGATDAEILEQAQKLLAPGALESAGRAAVNNLPLGGQLGAVGTSIATGKDYSPAMADWNAKIAEAKAAHPIAYGAGATAGALAPAAIPGIGELGAAGNAALGAAYGVGNVDVTKEPGEALKGAAIGAGVGGVLSKIMPTGEGAKEGLEDLANRKAVQSLNIAPGNLGLPKEELQDLGNFADEIGAIKGSTGDRLNTVRDLLGQTGKQLEEYGADAGILKDSTPFVEALHEKMQESAALFGPEANQEATVYRQAIANLSKPGITFSELQNLKSAVGNRAFDKFGNVKNEAMADVYHQISDAMESIVKDNPGYKEIQGQYSKLKDLESGLTSQLQGEQASGTQAKAFGMPGKLAATFLGGNPPATIGLASALAPAHPFMGLGVMTSLLNNPQVMAGTTRALAGATQPAATVLRTGSIAGILGMLQKNPQALGKYAKPLLQAAQTGGSQGVAATHFLLSQQYPEYNEMMLKNSAEKSDETER